MEVSNWKVMTLHYYENKPVICYHSLQLKFKLLLPLIFVPFMLRTDTGALNHFGHFGLIYSKWRQVYVKICWKCARNLQAGLWDLVTHIILWTSKWGVTKLTIGGTCMCWWVRCWCNITRSCPLYTCRTNRELSKRPIFGSITKTCINMCLVCDVVEFQC